MTGACPVQPFRDKSMTDEELIRFGKDVRRLAENRESVSEAIGRGEERVEAAKVASNGASGGWSQQRLENWRFAPNDLASEVAGGAGRKPSLCHASRQ